MNRADLQQIEVRYLGRGDYLYSSGWTVVTAPVRGLRTPSGKHEVFLRKGERTRLATWNSATVVGIIPASLMP